MVGFRHILLADDRGMGNPDSGFTLATERILVTNRLLRGPNAGYPIQVFSTLPDGNMHTAYQLNGEKSSERASVPIPHIACAAEVAE